MSFNMYVPTRFVFGNGRLSELSQYKMPGKKAMIVTTNGTSVFKNRAYDNTVEQLNKAGVASVLFNEVQANPLKSTVMNGAAFAKKNQCDFIVALGGGSVMDAAKAMAFMATNPGDLWDYIVGGSGKGQPMQEKPLPIVCITTTAGTGSEADQWGVISHDERNEKIGFGGGCINDTLIHLATSEMPFGGFGESGMGSYHGKTGFDTFTHYKSIVDKKTWIDLPMRYRPYQKWKKRLLHIFLK